MAEPASYKVIAANFQKVESEINGLAIKGWKVVTVTSYGRSDAVLVILEKPPKKRTS